MGGPVYTALSTAKTGLHQNHGWSEIRLGHPHEQQFRCFDWSVRHPVHELLEVPQDPRSWIVYEICDCAPTRPQVLLSLGKVRLPFLGVSTNPQARTSIVHFASISLKQISWLRHTRQSTLTDLTKSLNHRVYFVGYVCPSPQPRNIIIEFGWLSIDPGTPFEVLFGNKQL